MSGLLSTVLNRVSVRSSSGVIFKKQSLLEYQQIKVNVQKIRINKVDQYSSYNGQDFSTHSDNKEFCLAESLKLHGFIAFIRMNYLCSIIEHGNFI